MSTSDNENQNNDDQEEEIEEKLFCAERAKTGRSKCKRCKNVIDAKSLRVAKLAANPFGTGKMKVWHHLNCIFEGFKKQRATTPKIEKIDDIGGYEFLSNEDIEEILTFMSDDAKAHWETLKQDMPTVPVQTASTSAKKKGAKKATTIQSPLEIPVSSDPSHRDNSFRQFRKICLAVASETSFLKKTEVMENFFKKGTDGDSFKGDILLWCRLLLPGTVKTVYNLQNKQLVKLFSRIFQTNLKEMMSDLDAGDVSNTVMKFFGESKTIKPAAKSLLSLQEVDAFLQKLSTLSKEDEQQELLTEICEKCTPNDLQGIIRFLKHDLRISAGPKHVLGALHPSAYSAFQTCQDINAVIDQITKKETGKETDKKVLNISVKLMTPVLPMLASPCKSLEETIKKYANGLYVEIKYDGERVQLHKKGFDFKYFSRSLKPVLAHKVEHFASYIKKAFPFGEDIILDCEVLMIDTKTGDPLPFGTLGKHKKEEFKDANPCLFVFDCIYYNGQSLLDRPLKERYDLLHKNMMEIPNHIQFSEKKLIRDLEDLESMLTDVLDKGLEGLVLKDPRGVYEPGKRHWIKVKRDYLFEGKAADTVDLVVLGAWYGTGHKGGLMNVFLMGCFNSVDKSWRSVTKVHGLDDEVLDGLQTSLDMIKISRDVNKVPSWLKVTKTMVPDFVARDPEVMPVWEITGHEFTKHDVHTADGISIRFPRVVKIRSDKNWETATTLAELKNIFEVSKTNAGSRLKKFFFNSKIDDMTPSPKKNTRKRGMNETDDSDVSETTSPVKKPRKLDLDATSKNFVKPKKFPTNLLPDLLAGYVIKMKNSVSSNEEFRRHFIAYGAEIIDDSSRKKATHEFQPGSFFLKNKGGKVRFFIKS